MFIYFVVSYFCCLAFPRKYLNIKHFSVRFMKRCTWKCTIHARIRLTSYYISRLSSLLSTLGGTGRSNAQQWSWHSLSCSSETIRAVYHTSKYAVDNDTVSDLAIHHHQLNITSVFVAVSYSHCIPYISLVNQTAFLGGFTRLTVHSRVH